MQGGRRRLRLIATCIGGAFFLAGCWGEPLVPAALPGEPIVPYTFAVIGDYGEAGDPALQVAALLKSWNPEFILTTGDNNYESGGRNTLWENIGQYYCDFIYNPDAPDSLRCEGKATLEGKNRFFPTLGNHDFYNPEDHRPYLDFFTLPGGEEYYDFTWGPVHFFALNSGEEGNAVCCTSDQAEWLMQRLSTSTSPVRIVYFHHPPFSSGIHGNTPAMQWPFEAWGVDAVISGHNHLYQRIQGREPDAIPYFVNGLGGRVTRYRCEDNPIDSTQAQSICFDQNYGAMRVDVVASAVIFRFFSVDQPLTPRDEYRISY
jgi:hypothetical protein